MGGYVYMDGNHQDVNIVEEVQSVSMGDNEANARNVE